MFFTKEKFSLKNPSINDLHGFVMIVDLDGTILYVTPNIKELVGPHVIDVMGCRIEDLLHPEDRGELHRCVTRKNLLSPDTLMVRMKCTMAPTVRSQEKVKYKHVFVSSTLKKVSTASKLDTPGSMVAILLCRIDPVITGFPEIVMGAYLDFQLGIDARIQSADPKMPWLMGYQDKDVLGLNPHCLVHPKYAAASLDRQRNIVSKLTTEGTFEVPFTRVLSAWGQWIWVRIHITPSKYKGKQIQKMIGRMTILGPDDSEHTPPSTEPQQQMLSSDSDSLPDSMDELIDSILNPWPTSQPELSSQQDVGEDVISSLFTDSSDSSRYDDSFGSPTMRGCLHHNFSNNPNMP